MLRADFKAAQLPPPRGRGTDPDWLLGIGAGRPAFLVGGAGGVDDAPGLAAANGHIVIGTNWSLRLLVPTVWLVVDFAVWKSEMHRLAAIPESMVIVANKQLFGGGVYSTAHSSKLRMVGRAERRIAGITIETAKAAGRKRDGSLRFAHAPPRMPKKLSDPFHPGSNSLCFAVQLAHLMGCNPIVAVGFTLQNGLGYHFGRSNPVTGRTTLYEQERALAWLRWYNATFPGRLLLDPTFDGPVYQVLPKISADELQALHRVPPSPPGDSVSLGPQGSA